MRKMCNFINFSTKIDCVDCIFWSSPCISFIMKSKSFGDSKAQVLFLYGEENNKIFEKKLNFAKFIAQTFIFRACSKEKHLILYILGIFSRKEIKKCTKPCSVGYLIPDSNVFNVYLQNAVLLLQIM